MKSEEKKKKLVFKKTGIAQMDNYKIKEVKGVLSGEPAQPSNYYVSCHVPQCTIIN